jgi:HEAT repeat protein
MRWVRVGLLTVALWQFSSPMVAAPIESEEILIRRLIEALKEDDPDVRQNLASALAKLGSAAVEPLITALKDKGGPPERRAGAAYALGQIGLSAKAALPALLDALNDKELDVRRQAAYAVNRLIPNKKPAADAAELPRATKP